MSTGVEADPHALTGMTLTCIILGGVVAAFVLFWIGLIVGCAITRHKQAMETPSPQPAPRPTHLVTFDRDVTLKLCELYDVYQATPRGQDNAARHKFWQALLDACPQADRHKQMSLDLDHNRTATTWRVIVVDDAPAPEVKSEPAKPEHKPCG